MKMMWIFRSKAEGKQCLFSCQNSNYMFSPLQRERKKMLIRKMHISKEALLVSLYSSQFILLPIDL